jgi:predicted RNA-binding protein with PUA-like domain
MPAYWLIKTEPSQYAYDDLENEKRTAWGGVANPVAANNLRQMAPGDLAVVYHTGKERRVVGVAEVVAAGDPPTVAAKKRLAKPVGLAEIKAHKAFVESPLVKIGRLSVVPLTAAQWKVLVPR